MGLRGPRGVGMSQGYAGFQAGLGKLHTVATCECRQNEAALPDLFLPSLALLGSNSPR